MENTEGDDAALREEAEKRRYTADLIERGEAVPEGTELPPGATHQTTTDEQGRTVVIRKRFSAG
ncbi:hypothetical protein [Paractinoplanes rishiriensis]|uniref:Uncharacterized protein n=1 Tax=Paractinoplanes rishiriensis TaxID=1050105 RepID=A0A919JYR5_9ACTN|nr:hypothetical protein [Actinoplanes rishiriensis]GIE95689.1 hypothetical protein Ari01nite_31540 [Actinoplanes rishiriensis]